MPFQRGQFDPAAFVVGDTDTSIAATDYLGGSPVVVTPPGRTPQAVNVTAQPTYTLTEQGGFADARIPASIPPDLVAHLRLGELVINGAGGVRWAGHVRSAEGTGLVGQGVQSRFDDLLRGRVYTDSSPASWRPTAYPGRCDNISVVSDNDGKTVWTWQDGTKYKAAAYNGVEYDLPESQAVTLKIVNTMFSGSFTMTVRSGAASAVSHTYDGKTAGTFSLDLDAGPTVGVYIKNDSAFDGTEGENTISLELSITATNCLVAGALSLPLVVADIIQPALDAGLVATTDIDSTLTHSFDDLKFDASQPVLAQLSEVLKHGDWRAYVEWRVTGLCFVFAARPTVPAYALTEGSGDGWRVTVDAPPQSCEPMFRTVRARYVNAWGVDRFYDVVDDDPTHYLVDKGIPKVVSIDTGQTTIAAASAVGTRYKVDAGRDIYQAIVTIEGAPNGRLAADHLPGELVSLLCADGTHTARITHGDYDAKGGWAKLTLDNAPDLNALLSQITEKRWVKAHTR